MWSSLNTIEKPDSLTEAYSLFERGRKVFITGGSYLVAEKDHKIHTLIDINPLLDDSVSISGSKIVVGGGISLQAFFDIMNNLKPDSNLCRCIKWSCSSKNIRNQRSIAGEVAKRRTDSELYAFLFATNANLTVFTSTKKEINIRDWDGDGIITHLTLNREFIENSSVQRFAIIPSAPASVIVTGTRKGEKINLSVGGKARKLSFFSMEMSEFDEEQIAMVASKVVKTYQNDQYGSLDYKHELIKTLIKRVRSEL